LLPEEKSDGQDTSGCQHRAGCGRWVQRPATPLSYAGVARRTTRRAVAVGAAESGYGVHLVKVTEAPVDAALAAVPRRAQSNLAHKYAVTQLALTHVVSPKGICMSKNSPSKKQSSSELSTLASKVLSGEKKATPSDAKRLAASVLGQDETKGQKRH
jgi:hypothetical protein